MRNNRFNNFNGGRVRCCPVPNFFDVGRAPFVNGNCREKRYLEPILVARIYNQPIVEELPCYAMSMTVDNNATITNVCSNVRAIRENCEFCNECPDRCDCV
ncbi:MAG: hypothetical protein FWF05_02565 [Oscillospiraceae bacterium]|nr:hypothetical protein [Oscillospiraceae bacterium]